MDIRTIKVRIGFVVEPDEGGFHVYCPDLKGLHAEGATEEEAIANARDAAAAYMKSLLKHNDPIPVGVLESDEKTSIGELFGDFISKAFRRQHLRIEELAVPA